MKFSTLRNLVYVLFFFSALDASAQCSSPITTFPYVEDFETGPSWTTGGPACTPLGLVINDWAWGHPIKNVINAAGSGYKCWIVGDTSGWFYAYGERSWVQSPCMNFTNVQRPYVQMKIFYETEYKYDGTNFQYSTDGGTTWTDVGAYNDPTDCMDTNWYNYNSITNLGPYTAKLPATNTTQTFQSLTTGTSTNGWCGNIQASYHDTSGVSNTTCQGGHGLGHWLTAKHCMPYLSGRPSVIFRIAFGAGTGCNNFNGFAFDSVAIGEGSPNAANFTTSCVNTNTIQFTGIVPLCPDTFQWDFGDPASGASNTILGAGNLSPTHTFSGPGTYSVTFTVKGGPCNAPGSITKSVNVISVATTTIPAGCSSAGGSAIAIVSGSASPYTYAWGTAPTQTGDTATGLTGGSTYTVTVTSGSACSATASATIAVSTPMSHSVATLSTSCGANNGSAKVTESGGTPAYTYAWSNGLGSADSIKNVAAGSYILTITDSHGCTDTAHVTIAAGTNVTATITSTVNVSCYGGDNGSITISASGGTAPYTYHWGTTTTNNNSQTGFASGTYVITVTDINGCSATVLDNVGQPSPLSHTVSTVPAVCNTSNGAAVVIESGGNGGYTYIWSGGLGTTDSIHGVPAGGYTLTVSDSKGCLDTVPVSISNVGGVTATLGGTAPVTCPGGSDGTITISASGGTTPYTYHWGAVTNNNATQGGFAAGSYNITVTDAVGCLAIVPVTVTEPNPFSHTVSTIPATCGLPNGGAAVIETGGTPGYSYQWSNGLGTSATISGTAPGTYTLSITDAVGCHDAVTVTISSLPTITASLTSETDVSCYGDANGTITVSATGGTQPYTYHWGTSVTVVDSQALFAPGTYTVTVTDANSCSATVSATIHEPTPITVIPTATTLLCYGAATGSVSLSVSGGNGGYTYQWSNTTQTTQNISGLGADTYQVIVTDQKGCQKDTFASVAQPPAIVIAYPLVHGDSCYGNTYGIAIIAVSGGTPGYTYAWSNGATTDTIRGLGVGIYTFTVTDGNNCTVAGSPIQITSPDSLSASASLVIDSCESGVGSISVTVSGGIAPYQYVWSPVSGSTGQLSSLMKGTYALSVTDAYGCTLSGIYDLGDTCQRDSLVFPTAFSPNGDSKNDTFAPVYYGPIDDYQFHIYNRWGQLIFETTDPTKGWDGNYKGKPQPEEIYSYFCTFSAYGRARAREGTFTLLR